MEYTYWELVCLFVVCLRSVTSLVSANIVEMLMGKLFQGAKDSFDVLLKEGIFVTV